MASDGSQYFADNYFADGYWNENYWYDGGGNGGSIFGIDIPDMPTMISMPSIARQLNNMMVRAYLFIIGGSECLES